MTDKTITKKEKALELLKEMDIYKPYIRGFRESDKVCFFENFGGFWLHQEPKIDRKRKEIEAKYKCLVYAATHEFMPFGECWSFLIVTDYKSEWKTLMWSEGNKHTAFAYVSAILYESADVFFSERNFAAPTACSSICTSGRSNLRSAT